MLRWLLALIAVLRTVAREETANVVAPVAMPGELVVPVGVSVSKVARGSFVVEYRIMIVVVGLV